MNAPAEPDLGEGTVAGLHEAVGAHGVLEDAINEDGHGEDLRDVGGGLEVDGEGCSRDGKDHAGGVAVCALVFGVVFGGWSGGGVSCWREGSFRWVDSCCWWWDGGWCCYVQRTSQVQGLAGRHDWAVMGVDAVLCGRGWAGKDVGSKAMSVSMSLIHKACVTGVPAAMHNIVALGQGNRHSDV